MSPLIAYIVVRKLPERIRTDWENSHSDYSTYASFEPLAAFLQNRCFAYESVHPDGPEKTSGSKNTNTNIEKKERPKTALTSTFVKQRPVSSRICILCKQNTHYLSSCPQCLRKTVSERFSFVKDNKLCTNCLRQYHDSSLCNSTKCRKCDKSHHTLLHREIGTTPYSENRNDTKPESRSEIRSDNTSNESSSKKTVASTLDASRCDIVLLPSAVTLIPIGSK